MAVKGSVAKNEITQVIMKVFPGSFVCDKEIRIPFVEDGQEVQIKVTLTCAKNLVDAGAGVSSTVQSEVAAGVPDITPEEKTEVNNLITALGL